MKTIFVKDYDEMSKITFKIMKEVIKTKETPVISLTTGGTPRGLFKIMVEEINHNDLDISQTTFMNLDEYIGPKDAPYTVKTFMYDNFYNQINVQPCKIHLINGDSDNAQEEINRYKKILDTTKRDVQIIGLGTNGHIGANEPGTSFSSTIFLSHHDESTIQSTMREYDISRAEAPTEMITLGFTEILEAEIVILMVSGNRKAQAVKDILEGEISMDCPASYLRDKENVIMIVDEEAASLVSKKS